ncbi:MAG: phosphomannomutase [Methylotenera sp.]
MNISIQNLMQSSGVCFGTSGVRGLVTEITDEIGFAYTSAFLQVAKVKAGSRVALAIDLRPSSPTIAAACAAAIQHAGLQVDFCGAIPTPALAYYAQQQGITGIMVTGSHIPFDRNGIKFYGAAGEITKEDEANISQAIVKLPDGCYTMTLPEVNLSARQLYISRYLDYLEPKSLSGLRLGFYQHSSVARDLFTELLETLGAEVISLGRTNEFVPLDTEAVAEVDIQRAKNWASEYKFDAIISTDGDADRPLIGDENGLWMRGDIVGLLCAQYLQAQAVATPVSCNTAIEQCASFAYVTRTRIGSPYVIEAMEQMLDTGLQNIVGFEANGGFLLGSRMVKNGRELAPLLTRDAALPIISILAMAKEKGCKLSEITRDLPARFTASDRLQSFPTKTSREILLKLAASQTATDVLLNPLGVVSKNLDQTDGLRITLVNGEIIHFRPSGNAPELRCYVEATSQARADLLARESLSLIRNKL